MVDPYICTDTHIHTHITGKSGECRHDHHSAPVAISLVLMNGDPSTSKEPCEALTKIAAGAVRRGHQDAWLVQERRMAAATGGTLSFFGGAKEAQDQSMRDTMQRESADSSMLHGDR